MAAATASARRSDRSLFAVGERPNRCGPETSDLQARAYCRRHQRPSSQQRTALRVKPAPHGRSEVNRPPVREEHREPVEALLFAEVRLRASWSTGPTSAAPAAARSSLDERPACCRRRCEDESKDTDAVGTILVTLAACWSLSTFGSRPKSSTCTATGALRSDRDTCMSLIMVTTDSRH